MKKAKKRRPKEAREGSNKPIGFVKLRACRECGKKTHQYFRCDTCTSFARFRARGGDGNFSEALWGVTI